MARKGKAGQNYVGQSKLSKAVEDGAIARATAPRWQEHTYGGGRTLRLSMGHIIVVVQPQMVSRNDPPAYEWLLGLDWRSRGYESMAGAEAQALFALRATLQEALAQLDKYEAQKANEQAQDAR